MNIKDLQNKLVAVLGYGLEGKATTNYLIKHGVKPVLFDQKSWEKWDREDQDAIKKLDINFIFGHDCLKELNGYDVIFRSPGIVLSKIFHTSGIITSQTKWFFEHCPAKIIGVTGTKGKGTTASLIYEMLRQEAEGKKQKIYLTGNIGEVQPFDFLDNLTEHDWVVYELSSFQLQDLEQSPHIAIVLITTQEHLDYHVNQNEYVDAKSSITKFQTKDDFAIINADFENSIKIGERGEGKKIFFSRQKELNNGCFVQGNEIVFKELDNNFKIQITNIKLRGGHNLENICAGISASIYAGCGEDSIKKAIAEFKGLKHRLELVHEKSGIKFYNDSFSTTPETAIAAINAFNEPLILILGGSSKNSDFTELGNTINNAENIKTIILIGQEAARIKSKISPNIKILEGAGNMEEIFAQIKTIAAAGDIVLLSPACASFDMFKNYKDRGEQFKKFALKF